MNKQFPNKSELTVGQALRSILIMTVLIPVIKNGEDSSVFLREAT